MLHKLQANHCIMRDVWQVANKHLSDVSSLPALYLNVKKGRQVQFELFLLFFASTLGDNEVTM